MWFVRGGWSVDVQMVKMENGGTIFNERGKSEQFFCFACSCIFNSIRGVENIANTEMIFFVIYRVRTEQNLSLL